MEDGARLSSRSSRGSTWSRKDRLIINSGSIGLDNTRDRWYIACLCRGCSTRGLKTFIASSVLFRGQLAVLFWSQPYTGVSNISWGIMSWVVLSTTRLVTTTMTMTRDSASLAGQTSTGTAGGLVS